MCTGCFCSWCRVGFCSKQVLYLICNVYFCCPQDVPGKTLILFLLDTLSATWLLCLLNDSEVSRWTPEIFGHWTSVSCESSISILV